jgi:hypothetical protein
MNRLTASILGLGVSGIGVLAAVLSPDLSVELVGGGIAVAAAGAVSALWVAPLLDSHRSVVGPISRDPIGVLRGAFTAGTLAREQVVFTLQSLEFASGLRTGPALAPDQVRALLTLPRDSFQAWFESHLEALERET